MFMSSCSGSDGSGGGGGDASSTPSSWKYIDVATDSSTTIVAVRGGWNIDTNSIFYSTDGGSSWNASTGCSGGMNSVIYQFVVNKWLAGGSQYNSDTDTHTPQLCESIDGVNWSVIKTYPAYPNTTINVVGADSMGVAIARGKDENICFHVINDYTEINGLPANWDNPSTCDALPVPVIDQHIFASAFHVVGGISPSMALNSDGVNWSTFLDTYMLRTSSHVTVDGFANLYIMVAGDSGLIMRADNVGGSYTVLTTPTSSRINHLTSNLSNNAIAVGENGLVMVSSDANTWAVVDMGTTENLHSAVWDVTNSHYIIVGENDTTLIYTP